MGAYDASQFTNKAIALMNKAVLNEGLKIQFTKIVTSDVFPDGEDYKEMTEIPSIKQTLEISKIVVQDERTIKISGAVSNEELTSGYYVRTVGLYALDPDEGEILYSVTKAETADWMSPNDSISSTSLLFNLYTAVHNSENIILTIGSGTTATVQDINIINNYIENDLEPRVEALEEVAPNIAVNATHINTLEEYTLPNIAFCGITRDLLYEQSLFSWILPFSKQSPVHYYRDDFENAFTIRSYNANVHITSSGHADEPLPHTKTRNSIYIQNVEGNLDILEFCKIDDYEIKLFLGYAACFPLTLTSPNKINPNFKFLPRMREVFMFNGTTSVQSIRLNSDSPWTIINWPTTQGRMVTDFVELLNGDLLVELNPAFNPGLFGIIKLGKNLSGPVRYYSSFEDKWQFQLNQFINWHQIQDLPTTYFGQYTPSFRIGSLLADGNVLLLPANTEHNWQKTFCLYHAKSGTMQHIEIPITYQQDFRNANCCLLPGGRILITPCNWEDKFFIYNYRYNEFQTLHIDPNNNTGPVKWEAKLTPFGFVLLVAKNEIRIFDYTTPLPYGAAGSLVRDIYNSVFSMTDPITEPVRNSQPLKPVFSGRLLSGSTYWLKQETRIFIIRIPYENGMSLYLYPTIEPYVDGEDIFLFTRQLAGWENAVLMPFTW